MWYGKNDNKQDEACVCRIDPYIQKFLIDRALISHERLALQQKLESQFFDVMEKASLSEAQADIYEVIQKVLGAK